MVRRALFAATLLLVLSTSSVLAATFTVRIKSTGYGPASMTVAMGSKVVWKNKTGKKRVVAADTGFISTWFLPNTTVPAYGTSVAVTFPQAGSFGYHDTLKGFRGTISVPMKVDVAVITKGNRVNMTFGTVKAKTATYHYTQARLNGGAWITIATTANTSWPWQPTAAGTWEVHTRLYQALGGGTSGWSPSLTVTVLPLS